MDKAWECVTIRKQTCCGGGRIRTLDHWSVATTIWSRLLSIGSLVAVSHTCSSRGGADLYLFSNGLTFPSVVSKPTIRVLLQYNTVTSCTSHHETTSKFSSNPKVWCSRTCKWKIPLANRCQFKAISVNMLWGSFRPEVCLYVVKQRRKTLLSPLL